MNNSIRKINKNNKETNIWVHKQEADCFCMDNDSIRVTGK